MAKRISYIFKKVKHAAVLIDGRKNGCEALAKLLAKYCPSVEVMAKCASQKEAEDAIFKFKPDLIFWDIATAGGNASNLLMPVKENNSEIIFISDYEQYMVHAARFRTLDFLPKPIVAADLIEAVRRAGRKIVRHHHIEKMDSLLANIKYLNIDKKIALATLTGLEFVTIGNIIRCESDNTYTIFYMTDKSRIVVSKSIGEYESSLVDYHFLRVHQSHLINLRYVKNYNKGNGGSITMEDNSRVEVSRRRKEQLITRLSLI